MRRLATLFWIISLLVFLFVLIYTNLYLPTLVNVIGDDFLLEKSYYFYIVIASIVAINGALLLLGGSVQFVPSFMMPVPKRDQWMGDEQRRKRLYLNLKAWFKGLGFCFNLFLTAAMIDIYDINDADIFVPTAWIFVLIGLITTGWLVSYYFLFSHVPTDEELQVI